MHISQALDPSVRAFFVGSVMTVKLLASLFLTVAFESIVEFFDLFNTFV